METTNIWVAIASDIGIALAGVAAVALIIWATCRITDKVLDIRTNKLEKKYPEVFSMMYEYNRKLDVAVDYWNTNISPLMNEIDKLVADNYIQQKEKDDNLFQLREELKNHKEVYTAMVTDYKELYKQAQEHVDIIYSTDKRIQLIWTPSCKKETKNND